MSTTGSGDLATRTVRELRGLFVPGAVLACLDGTHYLMRVQRTDEQFVYYDTWTHIGPFRDVYYEIADFARIPLAPRGESDWLCAVLEGVYVHE
jgi:hypothetical protein